MSSSGDLQRIAGRPALSVWQLATAWRHLCEVLRPERDYECRGRSPSCCEPVEGTRSGSVNALEGTAGVDAYGRHTVIGRLVETRPHRDSDLGRYQGVVTGIHTRIAALPRFAQAKYGMALSIAIDEVEPSSIDTSL